MSLYFKSAHFKSEFSASIPNLGNCWNQTHSTKTAYKTIFFKITSKRSIIKFTSNDSRNRRLRSNMWKAQALSVTRDTGLERKKAIEIRLQELFLWKRVLQTRGPVKWLRWQTQHLLSYWNCSTSDYKPEVHPNHRCNCRNGVQLTSKYMNNYHPCGPTVTVQILPYLCSTEIR